MERVEVPRCIGLGEASVAHLFLRAQLRLHHGGRREVCRAARERGELGRGRARRPLRLERNQRWARPGRDFEETFPGDATGEGLSELRWIFARKAFISRQERLCRSMLAAGLGADRFSRLLIRDLPRTPEARAYPRATRRARHRHLGHRALSGDPGRKTDRGRGGIRALAVRPHRQREHRGERPLLQAPASDKVREDSTTGGKDVKAAVSLLLRGSEARRSGRAEPKIAGPHDVIVRIGAAGLCSIDLHIRWRLDDGSGGSGASASLHPRPRERGVGARPGPGLGRRAEELLRARISGPGARFAIRFVAATAAALSRNRSSGRFRGSARNARAILSDHLDKLS